MNASATSRWIRPHRRWATAVLLTLFCTLTTACAQSANTGGKSATPGQPGTPVTPRLMKALRQASEAGLQVKAQAGSSPLSRISGPSVTKANPPMVNSSKPGILYMGADFCPYCASLRWPLVLTLLRFGHFENLAYMRSSSSDVYANTISFSFHGATYKSRYLTFQAVEMADRQGNRLDNPDARQTQLFRKFDAQPYTPSPGGIPFLYIGGRYLASGAPFSPKLLKNLSWPEAAKQLQQKKTKLSRQVMSTTNLYTAAVCKLTQGKPARVCQAPGVTAAASDLPKNS